MDLVEPKVIYMNDGVRYVCNRCGVKYKKSKINFQFYLIHINFFQNNFTVSALRSHVRECGIGAKCPLCPKVVTQKRNLPKHMEKHKRDGLWGSLQELQEKYPDYVRDNYEVIVKDEIHI